MPTFKGLPQIIREQIKQTSTKQRAFPPNSTEAKLLDQDKKYILIQDTNIEGVYKWGVSAWGTDSVIGVDFPEDR